MEDFTDRRNRETLREFPFLDPQVEAAVCRISSLHKYLDRSFSETLARHDLNHGEYKLLVHLKSAGAPYRLSPSHLAREQQMSTGAMTNRLDRLERAGLVRRSPDPTDRRGVVVELTDDGATLLDQAVQVQGKLEAELLDALTTEEKQQLNDLMRKLLVTFEKPV